MTVFFDRTQETSSNTPTDTGTVSITLAGATQYNRTFAASGYVTTDDVLVHVYQTSNPALWCVVPGQFVDTPDRITFTDSDIADGSSGAGVSPTWTGTVTVGVEMVASIADAAVNAVTDHGALTGLADDDHSQYHTDARGDARYSPLGHNHAGVYDPAGTAAAAITAHDTTTAHAGIVAAQTTAATSKATPVDADEIPLADSAASYGLKKLTWANLKATVQSALDALYKLLPSGSSGQTLYHNGTQWAATNQLVLDAAAEELTYKTAAGAPLLKLRRCVLSGTKYDRLSLEIPQYSYLIIAAGGGLNVGPADNDLRASIQPGTFKLWSAGYFAWASSSDAFNGPTDTAFFRDSANTVGQKWAGTSQTYRLYTSYTDASNYERLTLTGTAGSSVELKAESAGTGAANLNVVLSPKGSGNVGIGTTSPTSKLDVNSDTIRLRTSKTPSSAADTGNQGEICWDSSYLYVCTAANTWKRVALSTW